VLILFARFCIIVVTYAKRTGFGHRSVSETPRSSAAATVKSNIASDDGAEFRLSTSCDCHDR